MAVGPSNIYKEQKLSIAPNRWDLIALFLGFAIIGIFIWSAYQISAPYNIGKTIPISLDPVNLPFYAFRTVLRMLVALLFSLLFTFIFGTLAAKSRQAEKLIIPLIDILQSVPVLAFQAISVVPFIRLFPNSILGPECAAVFAIFTSQAWNMVLGFFQTVRGVPAELKDAADVFQLSAWQRFWRLEVPFSMPSLLWNTMMSMSASWFFVVATEAISVTGQEIRLPGIGSYIYVAIFNSNLKAVFYAIIAMLLVILFYDQLIFRPLIKWAEKFRAEEVESEQETHSIVLDLLQKTRVIAYVGHLFEVIFDLMLNSRVFIKKASKVTKTINENLYRYYVLLWNAFLFLSTLTAVFFLSQFVLKAVHYREVLHVLFLGLVTATRVFVLIFLSSLVWVPIGVWIGRRPNAAQYAQPIVQFLAAFPANLFFPLFALAIDRFHLNVNIWTSPLMILGAQWYILFNVIAGASLLPKELYQAANNFGVKGWLWWKRIVLPGIFPYYITGAITAAGGAWNASIVAEVISWGHTKLLATGLGAYISQYTQIGDFHRIALGVGVMCLYVLAFNRLFWLPLYQLAERKYQYS